MSMIDLLPLRFKNSEEVKEFENAVDGFMEKTEAEKQSFFNQLNVDTATWGLSLWEKQYGIDTDISKSLDDRRSRIKSKLLGVGTTTKELIKSLGEIFSNGGVIVTEHNDQYYFEIEFVGRFGLPENINDLKAAVDEAKPAHLGAVYICKYRTYGDVEELMLTYGELEKYTFNEIREKNELN